MRNLNSINPTPSLADTPEHREITEALKGADPGTLTFRLDLAEDEPVPFKDLLKARFVCTFTEPTGNRRQETFWLLPLTDSSQAPYLRPSSPFGPDRQARFPVMLLTCHGLQMSQTVEVTFRIDHAARAAMNVDEVEFVASYPGTVAKVQVGNHFLELDQRTEMERGQKAGFPAGSIALRW
jgi:hypothetical protein